MNVSSYDPMAAKKRKMVYYLCGYACALAIVLSVIENAKKGVRVVGRQPFQSQDKTRQNTAQTGFGDVHYRIHIVFYARGYVCGADKKSRGRVTDRQIGGESPTEPAYFFFLGFFFFTPPDATPAGPGMGVAARSCSAWGASICDGAACGFAFRFVIFCMSERLRASNRLRKTDEDVLNLRH